MKFYIYILYTGNSSSFVHKHICEKMKNKIKHNNQHRVGLHRLEKHV